MVLAGATFSIVLALMFQPNFSNQMQSMNFMKNLAMARGSLYVVGAGARVIDRC